MTGLPELLAPAGSYEATCAALQYGADAVYLGLPRLSARAEAVNLDAAALRRIVSYAHGLQPRRAVYVTLNTLVRDDECGTLLDALELADDAGVDALIIQDLAVYRLAHREFPRLALHASTQLAIHDADGACALAELGFRRVVLARELGLGEIAAVAARAPIEIEVFVHGALCYATSGLCLFSALQAGRSGNRGQCAYCCRERFAATDGWAGHPFSMRDLARLDRVEDLRRAGVASLKLEGRMKSPLYVAAVTDLYRRKLDGRLSPECEAAAQADLQTIFSRPWTPLHLDGPQPAEAVIDALAVGHRGTPIGQVEAVRRERAAPARWLVFCTRRALEKHDGLQVELPTGGRPFGFGIARMRLAGQNRLEVGVPAGSRVEIALPDDAPPLPTGAPVFCSASQAVQRRFPLVTPREQEGRAARPLLVDIELAAAGARARGTPPDAPESAVEVEEPADLGPARQADQTLPAVRRAFERLGDSDWRLAGLTLSDAAGRYAPPSVLNRLRRRLREALDTRLADARAAAHAERTAALDAQLAPEADPPRAVPRVSVKLPVAAAPEPFPGAAERVLALGVADCGPELAARVEAWRRVQPGVPLRLALPPIVRGDDAHAAVERAVRGLLAAGFTRWECAGLADLFRLRRGAAGEALSLTADGALYGLNRLAGRQLGELGVEGVVAPAEADAAVLLPLCRLRDPVWIVPLYQRPALFLAETRPVAPPGDTPDGAVTLTDRRGRRFEVVPDDGRWITRAAEPLQRTALRAALEEAGVAELRIDLVGEAEGARAAVWRRCSGATPPPAGG